MKIVSQFLLLPVMLLLSVFGRAATFDQNSAVITNPYMPWNVGAEFILVGTGDAAGISLRYRCLTVESIGGVSCLKVETVDFGRANLRTYWWLAQDTDGNIWQLQQSDEQFDGSFETESGEWLYVPATFTLGESLELYGAYADVYTVVSLTGTAPTPYRMFTSCVVTELSEFGHVEQHFIAPGFGPVRATFSGFENGSFELQSVSGFNPPAQQAPVFAVHPNDQTIVEGEAAVFTASASGNPTPTYQWQRRSADSAAWSDLATGGSYSGVMSATLTVSGTTLAVSGDQFRCFAINAAGSATSNPATLTVLPRPTLRITRIWSDQLPGVEANFLPPQDPMRPKASPGAGKIGNQYNGILMGAREDGKGYVKAEFELDPPDPTLVAKVVLRLAHADDPNRIPVGEPSTLSGNVASLVIDLNDFPAPADALTGYVVTGWIDSNENGSLDTGDGEVLVEPEPTAIVIIVPPAHYNLALFTLKSGAFISSLALPIAADFLHAFVTGDTPTTASGFTTSSICADGELDFNVGSRFGAGGCGFVYEYQFEGSGNKVIKALLVSRALHEAVGATLDLNRQNIEVEFTSNPEKAQVERPLVGNEKKGGSYTATDLLIFGDADPDLGLSFHIATLTNAFLTVTRAVPNSVGVKGDLIDLYDWNYEISGFDRMAAAVQAGFPTLGDGNGGRVFRLKASFDGVVSGIMVDGTPFLTIGPLTESNALVLTVSGAEGSRILLENSTDLNVWASFKEIVLTNIIEDVELPVSLSNDKQFFRASLVNP